MKYDKKIIFEKVLPSYFNDLKDVQSSEANYASLLYHHLLKSGYSHKQICTEMYSANIVKDGTRPDLVIFDEGIDGRFNYYKDCDKKHSNTNLKIDNLRCIFEIKGGAQQHESGLGKYFRDDPLCKSLLSDPDKRKKTQNCALPIDIEKLAMWASHFGSSDLGKSYIFLAIDMINPKGFWPDYIRDVFGEYAAYHNVDFVYYAQGKDHFWHYNKSRNGQRKEI